MVYTGCAWSTRWATSPELICSLTKRAHCAALRGGVVVDSPTSVRKKHVEQQKNYIYMVISTSGLSMVSMFRLN